MEKFSVVSLAKKIPTEAAAYEHMEQVRWDGRPVCPHCGVIDGHYFLTPKNGTSRETSRGRMSERRTWKCHDCRRQFSVTTGTVMHGSHVALRTWLFIFFEMAGNKNGIAAREISRKYGVNPRSAWHITQRIREAMATGYQLPMMTGTVVVDEAYVGGEVKNKHRQGDNIKRRGGRKVGGPVYKTGVFSIVHKQTGEVRSWVMNEINSRTVAPMLANNVEMSHSILYTDSSPIYRSIGKMFSSHESVNHNVREYVKPNGMSTNKAENYFSQLKRSLDGTHHSVTPKHLQRYLNEFDYRYSTREITDADRMANMITRTAGRSLSYVSLRGPRSLSA